MAGLIGQEHRSLKEVRSEKFVSKGYTHYGHIGIGTPFGVKRSK